MVAEKAVAKEEYPPKETKVTETKAIPKDKNEIWQDLKRLLNDPNITLNRFSLYPEEYSFTYTKKEIKISETAKWLLNQE